MSHTNNQILEEQEFSRKEIEAMPEPETPEIEVDNTVKTDSEREMEDKGQDLQDEFTGQ